MSDEIFKKIISHAKEYGFVFQSSEIYDGLSAVYDYAQNGVLLKNNIKDYWWKSMVQLNDNIVGIDSAIFSHPTTWKASGHVDAFNDPMIDNKDSKKRYRADNLIEDYIQKIEAKIMKNLCPSSESAHLWSEAASITLAKLNKGYLLNIDIESLILDTFIYLEKCYKTINQNRIKK